MNVFFITRPEVSSGLRKTYNKKLEVFLGEVQTRSHHDVSWYYFPQATFVYTYNQKTDQWVKKPCTKSFPMSFATRSKRILDRPDFSGQVTFYTTLEAACVAKLVLVERLGETYKQELIRLQELFTRNVPDVKKPLAQLMEMYPDLFI